LSRKKEEVSTNKRKEKLPVSPTGLLKGKKNRMGVGKKNRGSLKKKGI